MWLIANRVFLEPNNSVFPRVNKIHQQGAFLFWSEDIENVIQGTEKTADGSEYSIISFRGTIGQYHIKGTPDDIFHQIQSNFRD